jgi:hypothetical protein
MFNHGLNIPDARIRTRRCSNCYACGGPGGFIYHHLPDLLFQKTGQWSIRRCSEPTCGLAWLDPMPVEEDLANAYQDEYYTHGQPIKKANSMVESIYSWVRLGYLAGVFSYRRENTSKLQRLAGLLMYVVRHSGRIPILW